MRCYGFNYGVHVRKFLLDCLIVVEIDAGRSRSMCGVIVVDAGRSRSTCLGRDAYIHDHT